CSNECEKVAEVLDNKKLENNIRLIFVPTTAGTGSEATSFAVVYRDRVKISVVGKSLLPAYTILDPLLLRSLPTGVLKATVLDALAQATESAWAVGATDESRGYSADAIRLIMRHMEEEDVLLRLEAFQQASYLAGKAINISKTTLCHSISYPITAYFGVAHGIAVFLSLPETARLNFDCTAETKQEQIQLSTIEKSLKLLFDCYEVTGINLMVEKLKGVMEKLEVKTRLRDYGIKESDLPMLASKALTKGRSDNNPRKLMEEEALHLLQGIY
ncbi:MAG: phosphonoacetaldehyde reductase, partial [bacterium]|nr:phosphonoacetaldehyde reductase [bacterium]